MHAREFFELVVSPTVDEFLADRLDLRKAMLSVLVLQSMPEYFFVSFANRYEGLGLTDQKRREKFLKNIREENKTTGLINEISNVTKHVRPKSNKRINEYYIFDATNKCGLIRCGVELSDHEIWVDEDRVFLLKDIVKDCREYWKSKLELAQV